MPQLYLPAAHTDADLVLASLIAARIDSAELHVAWSAEHGQVAPQIPAVVRDAPVSARSLLTILGAVLRAIFGRSNAHTVLAAPTSPTVGTPQRKAASDPS